MLIEAEGREVYLPFSLSFYHIIAHIHAMVQVYIPKYSPYNTPSNDVLYLAIHVF